MSHRTAHPPSRPGPVRGTVGRVDERFTDEELGALALAADPDAPIDPDAVPFGGAAASPLLPAWYMPAPQASARGLRRRFAVGVIVLSLLIVNGVGLCVTYGLPEIAW